MMSEGSFEVNDDEEACECSSFGIALFVCAGGSNVGLMTVKAASRASIDLGRDKAALQCLPGISAEIPAIVMGVENFKGVIVVDGCPTECAFKTLEKFGVKTEEKIVISKDFDIKKNHDLSDENGIERVFEGIKKSIQELLGNME